MKPKQPWNLSQVEIVDEVLLLMTYYEQLEVLKRATVDKFTDGQKHKITIRVVVMRTELKRRGLINKYGKDPQA